MSDNKYDIIIIGGGAAGFTAGIYAGRRGLKTLIVSKDIGGQAALTCKIENYPAVGLVEGPDLMKEFLADAQKFGAEVVIGEVINLKRNEQNEFIVSSDNGEFQAPVVILAFGLTPRDLEIPGESEYKHKGVTCTALVNPEKYKDQDVCIIGGGNSALSTAIILAEHAKSINIIHRRDQFRGESVLIKRLEEYKNINLYLEHVPVEIKGNGKNVKELVIAPVNDPKNSKSIATSSVFVNIGFKAKTSWLGDLVDYSTTGHIEVNKHCKTKTPGLYAAGDVTDLSYKQVIISAGDGAKAMLAAYEYLKKEKGHTGTSIDWGIV